MSEFIYPRLYLIMRSDIPDMTPGKLAAQCSHVTSVFEDWGRDTTNGSSSEGHYYQWKEQAQHFGTTIVLSATKANILKFLERNYLNDAVIDPSYPWKNYYGESFLSEEIVGTWFFAVSDIDVEEVSKFSLHK